jgi:hypothetical protein
VCVDLRLLDTDFAEQFRKSAAGLAAQAGKNLGERSGAARKGMPSWRLS